MAKASPAIINFNGGELSPLMAGRVDIKYYNSSCKKLLNFIPSIQGPARKRPGTMFVHEVKNSANRTWLRRFVFNENQAYVLEFGDQYIRFYTNHGIIESAPATPYEISTVFTAASLVDSDGHFTLKFVQSGDVVYITSNGQYPVQKLTRLTANTFSIAELATVGGPFEDIDPDAITTVYASAATGAGITLTASASLFTANHVGSMIFLEQKSTDAIKYWEVGKAVSINDVRKSDGKNYKALTSGTTGTWKPVHSYGARYDGDPGVQWEFQDPGYGWALITGYTNPTTVTATVISRIPAGAVGAGNPTNRWAFSSFSKVNGYPDNIGFFRERLVFSKKLKMFFSVAADYENFSKYDDGGLVTADMAIQIDITSEESNAIVWMAASSSALLVGTSGEEFAVDELTASEAFAPGNVKASRQSRIGSKFIDPMIVGSGIVFVQKAGRKVRDMILAESVEKRWTTADLTVLADHITAPGVEQMAYQQEPDSVIWCRKSDGAIVGFTLNREQDVRGWHPHAFGGEDVYVESIETIPTATGDELWLIIRRTVNGTAKRYVEYMTPMFEYGDHEDAFFVDSGLTLNNAINATLTPGPNAILVGASEVFNAGASVFSAGDVGRFIHYDYEVTELDGSITNHKAVAEITAYTSGTQVSADIKVAWPDVDIIPANEWRMTSTVISGLGHLEGETVTILGDGAVIPSETVVSGQITIDSPASKVHVGLPYRSVLRTMPIEAGAADGTSQGKTRRISRMAIRLDNTSGVKYGPDEYNLDELSIRDASDLMDVASPLFTGDVLVSWPDGYTDQPFITIVHDYPLPCTVVGAFPQITTQDSR
jgi:hypothetical protein